MKLELNVSMHDAKIKFFLSYIFEHKFTQKQNTISEYNICDALDNNTKLLCIFTVTLTQVITLIQDYILNTDTTNNIVTTYTHP
jgi:hypothetical protein